MRNNSLRQEKYLWSENYFGKIYMKEFNNYSHVENFTLEEERNEYVFDRMGVRIPFIVAYSVVFCCCVFCNLMVILLITLNRRLKSTTNFFLANLAFADLCVGIFCVFQNLAFYLISSWVFGEFLCKMNQFIHGLSCTASILILMVICMERYLAIIYPIRCKQILTRNRLKVIIILVWIISSAYSMPRYLISHTICNPLSESSEIICVMSRVRYNSKAFDLINFFLLYLIPLSVFSVLYSLIAVKLWHSGFEYPLLHGEHCNTSSIYLESKSLHRPGKNVLQARRRVIRMLTIIVLAFAFCNLPFHARKMWQYWSKHYDGASTFSTLFTPITFLCTYSNSAINPLLYAFFSKNFQKSLKEFLTCSWKRRS